MKKIIVLLSTCIFFSLTLKAQENIPDEKEAIKKVITESYIEGVFNKGNADTVKRGIHYDCDIIIFEEGKMRKEPAYSYVERLEKTPIGLYSGTTCKFTEIHTTGYAGMAVVEIFRGNGWHNYTDYISLYKFVTGN